MRIGVIGCGNVAVRGHLPAIAATDGLEVVAVADPTPERLAAAADAAVLGPGGRHADWRDLLARDDLDAVVVATPQRIRPEIAIAAAASGRHLLLEKPLALTPAAAWAIVDAAERAGVVVATNHNYVFMPIYRAIKNVIASGEIGAPELAVLNFMGVEDRPGAAAYAPRWRHTTAEAGGGVLTDMLHAVYLGDWLLDAKPVAVAATIDRRLGGDGDVEDLALVRYRYPSGYAQINMAWGNGPGGVEITGTAGRLVLINQGHGTHPFVPPDRIVVVSEAGEREIPPEPPDPLGFAAVYADFRDAVAADRSPMSSGADGARVLEAVVGAYAAGALGREVALPLAPDDPVYQRGAAGIGALDLPPDSPVLRRGMFGVPAAV
ncbi:MAG TPA: Gfo/Idh/MocA family oxidoreductase [Thermomicrobiales bacterium]|nr:Gfo/Idh/MocA family oxidoreductase [Thermomicrobiales bacterium]